MQGTARSRRRRHGARQSSARSKAALQAAAQGLPREEWRSQVFCQKYQLMEAVAREKCLVPGVPTCVAVSDFLQLGPGISGLGAQTAPEGCWKLADRNRQAVNTPQPPCPLPKPPCCIHGREHDRPSPFRHFFSPSVKGQS